MKTILFQGDSITDCGRGNALGVHLSPMGHTLIKNALFEGFQRLS